MQNLQELLKNVPDGIRDWLGSEKTTYSIIAINKKFGIGREKIQIIPTLILRLEVRNLQPQNFAAELSKEFNRPLEELKPIIEEIKKNILLPIDAELFKWGVDIRQISAAPATGWAQGPKINRVEITPIAPASQKPASAPAPQPAISQPSAPQPSNAPVQTAPVMLYKKEEPKPLAASIKPQTRGEMTADTKPEVKQVAARVEIGPEAETLTGGEKKEPVIARTPQPEFPKVVHYTDFKTPVDNKGQTAAPPKSPEVQTSGPAQKPAEEVVDLNTFNQPKIEGNTLDLR